MVLSPLTEFGPRARRVGGVTQRRTKLTDLEPAGRQAVRKEGRKVRRQRPAAVAVFGLVESDHPLSFFQSTLFARAPIPPASGCSSSKLSVTNSPLKCFPQFYS